MIHFKHTFEDFLQQHLGNKELVCVCRSASEVGTEIRRRRECFMSQRTLARRAKTHQSVVDAVEKNPEHKKVSTLIRIANALNLDMHIVLSKRPGKFNL